VNDESALPLYASIAANVAIAATKFTAAAITGSSAMAAEGIHSLVDSFDGTLLLVGRRRSRRPPDEQHPFGHGQELYFWSLMVAVLFFVLGGGISIYQGVQQVLHPEPLGDPTWNYVVLGLATLFDGTSFLIAFRAFRKQAQRRGLFEQLRRSKDPSVFTVVLEDGADLVGIALAFLGVYFAHRLDAPALDGAASVAVGLVLTGVALVLLRATKSLLIGEAADPEVVAAIRDVVARDPLVAAQHPPLTVHLGPREIFLAVAVEFVPALPAGDVASAIDHLETQIRQAAPDVKHIFMEAAIRKTVNGER
jgi:cation diffusion facilitator family transporter